MAPSDDPPGIRVIHLADYGGPYAGSFVPMLLAVLGEVRSRGWTPEVVFSEASRGRTWLGEFEQAGVPVRFLPRRPRRTTTKALRELLADDRSSLILHTHFTSFDLPSVAAKLGRRERTVVWHVHDPFPTQASRRLRRRLKYVVGASGLSAAVCVGKESADDLGRVLRKTRIIYLPNAVDLNRFPQVTPDVRRQAKRELGLPDEPLVLHFGWDWYRKGGDVFVETIASLRRRGSSAVGVTVSTEAAARADLDRVGLDAGAIVFQPPADPVSRLYAAADVFVSCSRSEGHPYSVLEAHASGLGTVVSAVPGQTSDAVAGRRTVPLDPELVAGAVDELLARTAAEQEEDAQAARAWVEENASLPAYARRIADIYVELIAASTPAGA